MFYKHIRSKCLRIHVTEQLINASKGDLEMSALDIDPAGDGQVTSQVGTSLTYGQVHFIHGNGKK